MQGRAERATSVKQLGGEPGLVARMAVPVAVVVLVLASLAWVGRSAAEPGAPAAAVDVMSVMAQAFSAPRGLN
jgi:hypothetical protein